MVAGQDDAKRAGSSDKAGAKRAAGGDEIAKVSPIRTKRPCPECGRPSTRDSYPFCSTRCKNVDLNRWLSGSYAIPVREDEEQPSGQDSLQDDQRDDEER